MTKFNNIETTLVQLGNRTDPRTGAVATPIILSTAYGRDGLGESTGWDYTRTKNPTRAVLEQGIADLEGGDAGFAMASGMAAIQLVMSLFKAPDEWIISSDVYGGSYRLFDFSHKHHNTVKPVYVNTADLADIEAAITPNTKAIFVETPSNPLMEECDVDAISVIAKKHNLMLIVDNTFLSPVLFRPIEHGADIVIHSATKYLSGKSGMLSFRLQKEEWVPKFLKAIKLITFAESLGGTESFITYPATQTHMDIPEAERIARGITNNLLRFSVGLEHVEDLKADLRQAFEQLK